MELPKFLVIYHANCMDGFGAAAVASSLLTGIDLSKDEIHEINKYKAEVCTMPLAYPRDMEDGTKVTRRGTDERISFLDLIGDNEYHAIYMVDFSVKYEEALALFKRVREGRFVILDHHNAHDPDDWARRAEAEGEHQFLEWLDSGLCVLNSQRSGTGLVLDNRGLFNVEANIPEIMVMAGDLISDRDNWIKANGKAFTYHEGISPEVFSRSNPTGTIEYFGTDLLDTPPYALARSMLSIDDTRRAISEGRVVENYRDTLLRGIVESDAIFYGPNKFYDQPHVIVPCPASLASEMGDYLRSNFPKFHLFLMTRPTFKKHVPVSVRSRVSHASAREFAQRYGGNGHPAAAGCAIKATTLSAYLCNPYAEGMRAEDARKACDHEGWPETEPNFAWVTNSECGCGSC